LELLVYALVFDLAFFTHTNATFLYRSLEEQNQTAISFGTATLLDYLHSSDNSSDAETTTRYSLALGADTFCDLVQGKWKESARVLQLVDKFYVFARKETPTSESNEMPSSSSVLQDYLHQIGDRAILLQVDHLQDVSSSKARECTNVDELKSMVPEPVVEYILQHGLYAIGKQHSTRDDS
jgi:nicotinic acid mononucleotide adenylyltransferase